MPAAMARSTEDEGEGAAAEHDFALRYSQDRDGRSFLLPLPPSQPPDIRDWFSSYVYESPDSLGLPDGVGSPALPHEAEEEYETQDPVHRSRKEDTILIDFPTHEKNLNHGIQNADSFVLKFGGRTHRENSASDSSPGRVPLRSKCKDVPQQERLSRLNSLVQENVNYLSANVEWDGLISVKNEEDLRRNDQRIPSKWTREGDLSDIPQIPVTEKDELSTRNKQTGKEPKEFREENFVQSKRKVSLKKLFGEELHVSHGEKNGSSLSSSSLDRCPAKYSQFDIAGHLEENKGCGRIHSNARDINTKEEDEGHWNEDLSLHDNAENAKDTSGFISTKNKEKCIQEEQASGLNLIRKAKFEDMASKAAITSEDARETMRFREKNGAFKGKEQVIGTNRSPLRDKTNYQTAAATSEVPGKWQCPRRAKADMGPPTKQLRLDCWFNRLNVHSKIM
ncbi:hypothetical protein Cni_G14839 [Canna indica]|uniref:Uncharacterized protein n=1 Tax=Canna indica TaxID=4628 RepID=A0AAQ3KH09_9LILI|nr:hypothetical protein Cni_G14839 [Canna indica]